VIAGYDMAAAVGKRDIRARLPRARPRRAGRGPDMVAGMP
jgi:hypothetical protein